jgi:toxin HigB-1
MNQTMSLQERVSSFSYCLTPLYAWGSMSLGFLHNRVYSHANWAKVLCCPLPALQDESVFQSPVMCLPRDVERLCLEGQIVKTLDDCTVLTYDRDMHIRSVRHRGLRRFLEDDDDRGLRPDLVDRVRKILAVLIVAPDMRGVQGPPGWRVHQLFGNRAGTWSISVTGNWRITFEVEDDEILHLDLEDYH